MREQNIFQHFRDWETKFYLPSETARECIRSILRGEQRKDLSLTNAPNLTVDKHQTAKIFSGANTCSLVFSYSKQKNTESEK